MDDLDLSEFHGVFFEEAEEHLATLETLLVVVDEAPADAERLDAIFRAAHSIKGGAAAFGFADMAALTHEMETTFDGVRKGRTTLSKALVDAFLDARDLLTSMIAMRKGERGAVPDDDIAALCERLRRFADPADAAAARAAPKTDAPPPRSANVLLDVVLGPFDAAFPVTALDGVVAALATYGSVTAVAPKPRARRRTLRVATDVGPAELADAVAFVAPPGRVDVRVATAPRAVPVATTAPAPAIVPHPSAVAPLPAGDASSIRVGVQKVDALINLVGELVITQAMLAEAATDADAGGTEALLQGIAQLQRNTRALQESAMSIRMLPMSLVFGRFPRVVRDLAASLGKDVQLRTEGEATELDRGLIERIVDPLTHLVRNALDHGIEPPGVREAAGKPPAGTVTLRAFHRGGAIVVEVGDDGAGMSRGKILAKARERGIAVSDAVSDAEVFALIFEAGFSTAETVTDVSGRGVGMDVVRRNIRAMGGSVDIDSVDGAGTRITIRLPLTLAILDGMSVRVGDQVFIVPLANITEALQPTTDRLRTIAGRGGVVQVRGDYLPVVALHEAFGVSDAIVDLDRGIMVVLEHEGQKTALFVDELLGQQQVVIKSLETNYRRVAGASGATILGDGRVALILDVAHLVGPARRDYPQAA